MKKLLIVVALIGALIAVGSAVTRAGVASNGPTLTANPATGSPGFEGTATVEGCIDDEWVEFVFVFTPISNQQTTCEDGTAEADFTAPMRAGMYTIDVTLDDEDASPVPCDDDEERPCTLTTNITVVPPSLIVSPDSGQPGFEFTMTVLDCIGVDSGPVQLETDSRIDLFGQLVVSFYVFDDQIIEDDVIGADEEVPCDDGQTPSSATSAPFTAPMEPGTYPVLAYIDLSFDNDAQPRAAVGTTQVEMPPPCDQMINGSFPATPCVLESEITVEETPPVTDPPVTDPPATTEPPATTTTVVDVPTTTIAEDAGVPAPTEPPVIELPATGTGTNSTMTAAAILLLLAGGALVIVSTRRRTPADRT